MQPLHKVLLYRKPDLEAEAEADAQATANKILTPTSVEPVVTPKKGTGVESPNAKILVDKSFVLSLGLTGKYKPIGDRLINE